MKNIVLITLVLSIVMTTSCNKVNVPPKVSEAFAKKFPDVKAVVWEEESEYEWEAEFEMNGKEISVCFGKNGNWLETIRIQKI